MTSATPHLLSPPWIAMLALAAGCAGQPDDPAPDMNPPDASDMAMNQDMARDGGGDAMDMATTPPEDSGDDGGGEVAAYDDFMVRACRAQSDGSVTIYASHTSEPAGCVLVTLATAGEAVGEVSVNDGWRVIKGTVSPAPGCPTLIPGEAALRAPLTGANGEVTLTLVQGDFPTHVDALTLTLSVSGGEEKNPFGDAVLSLAASDVTVSVCPETDDGG